MDQTWEYVNRSQTHECGNWDWGHTIPKKGIHKLDFPFSVYLYLLFTFHSKALFKKNLQNFCTVSQFLIWKMWGEWSNEQVIEQGRHSYFLNWETATTCKINAFCTEWVLRVLGNYIYTLWLGQGNYCTTDSEISHRKIKMLQKHLLFNDYKMFNALYLLWH